MEKEIEFNLALKFMQELRGYLVRVLDKAFETKLITQRERDVIYFRHIDWNSLSGCGEKFGVTRERIRQIESLALEKLKYVNENS